jgi:hypothetical protein
LEGQEVEYIYSVLPAFGPHIAVNSLEDVSSYFQNINPGRLKVNDLYKSVTENDYDVIVLLETYWDESFCV